jgi:hypothetical protein
MLTSFHGFALVTLAALPAGASTGGALRSRRAAKDR